MGSIGEIMARRAAMPGVAVRPRGLPRGNHTGPASGHAGCESPTASAAAGGDSEKLRAMALLRGIEPKSFATLSEMDREVERVHGLEPLPFAGLGVDPEVEVDSGDVPDRL